MSKWEFHEVMFHGCDLPEWGSEAFHAAPQNPSDCSDKRIFLHVFAAVRRTTQAAA